MCIRDSPVGLTSFAAGDSFLTDRPRRREFAGASGVPVGKLAAMVAAAGVRIGWADLPEPVRAGVEAVLAAPVVTAVSQRGGFSPGCLLYTSPSPRDRTRSR